MDDNQLPLFTKKTFPASSSASPIELTPPTGESTVMKTLFAYHMYLKSTSESKYTPDDFYGDIKKLRPVKLVYLPDPLSRVDGKREMCYALRRRAKGLLR